MKFTICYRNASTDEVHCEHGEGRTWMEAANSLVEKRLVEIDKFVGDRNELSKRSVADYQVLHAFKGHHRQLVKNP